MATAAEEKEAGIAVAVAARPLQCIATEAAEEASNTRAIIRGRVFCNTLTRRTDLSKMVRNKAAHNMSHFSVVRMKMTTAPAIMATAPVLRIS